MGKHDLYVFSRHVISPKGTDLETAVSGWVFLTRKVEFQSVVRLARPSQAKKTKLSRAYIGLFTCHMHEAPGTARFQGASSFKFGGEGEIRTLSIQFLHRLFSDAKKHKPPIFSRKIGGLFTEYGGEGEIRTLDTVSCIHTFQACSLSHSDTSPYLFKHVLSVEAR